MIDISVIIPVYNAGSLIKRCLDSVLAQKGEYTYEVLLIDDGSTDNSIDIIRSYNNPHFKIFQQKNAGPATARNVGITHAQGKYMAFLDADDYWENEFFNATISFIENHKECVAVTVGQKHLTISGNDISPICLSSFNSTFVLKDFFEFWGKWMHVCTGSIILSTACAKEIGGQRRDLRITEDLEFWALLSTYGKFGFIPQILFTSDGTNLVQNNKDWLAKMKRRWENAPSIEDWQKRIVERNPDIVNNIGYKSAIGRVSRNLTYCQLLSDRIKLARSEAKKYGKYFPKDVIGRLMNLSKHTSLTWWVLCKLLKYREYHRL